MSATIATDRKILFVYPSFNRHAADHPELLEHVPMEEYLGSPSLGMAMVAATTPEGWQLEYRDDRLRPATFDTDADIIALSFFTAAASRGLEIADWFRARGKTVVAGGIFPTMMPDEVAPHVDAVVVGEGEAVWPRLLADFEAGNLAPRYRAEPMDLSGALQPRLDLYFGAEEGNFQPDDYPLQLSRGCMLRCHACALPGTMGSSIRAFDHEHVMGQLAQLTAAGKRACLTEDTSWLPGRSSRGRLEVFLDAVIESGQRAAVSYIGISMPMILATPLRVLEKAKTAGVDMFYLVGGFDPVTMNAFTGESPKQLQRAYDAIARCFDVGIEPYTSFLYGGDQDDVGTVDRMLGYASRAGIRKAEFAIATPYPGTPQWHQVVSEDRLLTREWRRFNDANPTFRPKQLTPDQVLDGYLTLWREFYRSNVALQDLPSDERTIQF